MSSSRTRRPSRLSLLADRGDDDDDFMPQPRPNTKKKKTTPKRKPKAAKPKAVPPPPTVPLVDLLDDTDFGFYHNDDFDNEDQWNGDDTMGDEDYHPEEGSHWRSLSDDNDHGRGDRISPEPDPPAPFNPFLPAPPPAPNIHPPDPLLDSPVIPPLPTFPPHQPLQRSRSHRNLTSITPNDQPPSEIPEELTLSEPLLAQLAEEDRRVRELLEQQRLSEDFIRRLQMEEGDLMGVPMPVQPVQPPLFQPVVQDHPARPQRRTSISHDDAEDQNAPHQPQIDQPPAITREMAEEMGWERIDIGDLLYYADPVTNLLYPVPREHGEDRQWDIESIAHTAGGFTDAQLQKVKWGLVCEKHRKNNAEDETVFGTCSVCLCSIDVGDNSTIVKKCNHAFHTECLKPWLKTKKSCPVCRGPLGSLASGTLPPL